MRGFFMSGILLTGKQSTEYEQNILDSRNKNAVLNTAFSYV
ncbi:Uncharacterised protein [Pragia fontium]|nr:Uncharacterised protein [Pragia fontium]